MLNQIPIELISNLIAIVLLIILGLRFLKYKKNVDVLQGLDELKKEKKLSEDDIDFINKNEREYKEKIVSAEANVKLAQPILILIAGIILIYFSFQEALIYMNSVVVAFIFLQVDRIHKRNLYNNLFALKKEIKQEQKEEERV